MMSQSNISGTEILAQGRAGGSGRYRSIDIWRGVSISLVVMSHMFFGLYGGEVTYESAMNDPLLFFFALFGTVAPFFFVIAGSSAILGMHIRVGDGHDPKEIVLEQLKRAVFLLIIGTLIDPLAWDFHLWIVDTLQINAFTTAVIACMYYPWLKQAHASRQKAPGETPSVPPLKKIGMTFLVTGIVVVFISPVVRQFVGYPVYDPTLDHMVMYQTPATFIEAIQAWLTTSFFPIFPCSAYFLFGAFIGCRLLALRTESPEIKRQFVKKMIIWGIISMGIFVMTEAIAEIIAVDILIQSPSLYPTWVIELAAGVQPIPTGYFMFLLGITLLGWGILMRIFDLPHPEAVTKRYHALASKLKLRPISHTLERFSRASLTLYVLQFSWLLVFRFVHLWTGIQWLYTIENTLALIDPILLAFILFGILSYYWDQHEYKYTLDRLERRFMRWHPLKNK